MMWSNVYRVTQVYNVQRTLFHYRTHETQISTAKRQAQIEKSNEVRLKMLNWLDESFNDEEKHFFLNVFVPCDVCGKASVDELKQFAELLISRNILGHYDSEALRNKFWSHISYGVLNFAERRYFSKGYGLPNFFRLLFSGLYRNIPAKNRRKLLVKSMLMKKK